MEEWAGRRLRAVGKRGELLSVVRSRARARRLRPDNAVQLADVGARERGGRL